MLKHIFRIRNKEGSQDEFLAPETRPIIYQGAKTLVITKGEDNHVEKINYKLFERKRKEHRDSLY